MKSNVSVIHPPGISAPAPLRLVTAFVWCGALALLAGCASHPGAHVVSAPPPAPPDSALAPTASSPVTATFPAVEIRNLDFARITSTRSAAAPSLPPTVLLHEIRPDQPSWRHVWIGGHWTWSSDAYAWMAGHWELPPEVDAVWTAPRWENFGRFYEFHDGFWIE